LDHHSTIVNRISVAVTGTDNNGGATHEASFMTTEDATGSKTAHIFRGEKNTKVFFHAMHRESTTISDEFFMPVVRDVPVFPKKAVGSRGTVDGRRTRSTRSSAGIWHTDTIQSSFHPDIHVSWHGKKDKCKTKQQTATYDSLIPRMALLHVFNVKYTLYYESPRSSIAKPVSYSDWPAMTMGLQSTRLFTGTQTKGAIDHYGELVRIIIETAYGTIYEFRGDATCRISPASSLVHTRHNKTETVASVQKEG